MDLVIILLLVLLAAVLLRDQHRLSTAPHRLWRVRAYTHSGSDYPDAAKRTEIYKDWSGALFCLIMAAVIAYGSLTH